MAMAVCTAIATLVPVAFSPPVDANHPALVLAKNSCFATLKTLIQSNRISHYAGTSPQLIYVPLHLGTQLLFWTPHSALASWYHNDTEGLRDYFGFYFAATPQAARVIAGKRHIDMIAMCDNVPLVPLDNTGGEFLPAVMRGDLPSWLQVIAQTEDPHLHLYRLVRQALIRKPAPDLRRSLPA